MAGADTMTIAEVVREVLRDEHADVSESVRAVAQELMEAEISELIGAQLNSSAIWGDDSAQIEALSIGQSFGGKSGTTQRRYAISTRLLR